MAFALPELQQIASDDEDATYYSRTYGGSRLSRAYKITRDCAALLRPEEQGRPGLVNAASDAVQQLGPAVWRVRSQRDRDVFYTVRRRTRRRYTCTCPDPDVECKHKKAVRFRGVTGLAVADPTLTVPQSPLEQWQALWSKTVHARLLPGRHSRQGHRRFWVHAAAADRAHQREL